MPSVMDRSTAWALVVPADEIVDPRTVAGSRIVGGSSVPVVGDVSVKGLHFTTGSIRMIANIRLDPEYPHASPVVGGLAISGVVFPVHQHVGAFQQWLVVGPDPKHAVLSVTFKGPLPAALPEPEPDFGIADAPMVFADVEAFTE
jgi:hypothetical protein